VSVRPVLRRYVLENHLFTDDDSALNDADSFLETGTLDSTGIMELILFMEETFQIKVSDDEMVPEYLDSIDSLVAYVERKQAQAAGAIRSAP
jgi:acyl carrier protein